MEEIEFVFFFSFVLVCLSLINANSINIGYTHGKFESYKNICEAKCREIGKNYDFYGIDNGGLKKEKDPENLYKDFQPVCECHTDSTRFDGMKMVVD